MSRGKANEGFGARSRAKEDARPASPPKVRDTYDERAEKAEKIAHQQHSTSLLAKESAADRGRPAVRAIAATARGSEPERGGGVPFALQILGVMALAGAAAFGISAFAPELMYSVL